MTLLRRLLCASLLAVVAVSTATGVRAEGPGATTRLVALARVWGFVKYRHPYLAYRPDLDWDAALVDAIPRVRAAGSVAEFAAAVEGMLATLGDPQTRIEPPAAAVAGPSAAGGLSYRTTDDGVVVVTVGDYYALSSAESQAALQRVLGALASARAVVLDVRSAGAVDAYGRMQLVAAMGQIERRITSHSLQTPGERRSVFYGFESPSPFSSGQYRTGFFTRFGTPTEPAKGARDVPCVVLANANAALPEGAVPLQAAGRGLIVFEGDPGAAKGAATESIELGEGVVARVRIAEAVLPDGTSAEVRPDLVTSNAAEDAAVTLARDFHPSTVARPLLPASAEVRGERSYAAMEYPSPEYRLLALVRFWSAIEYFYPYKRLLREPWSAVLAEFIPKFDEARDAADYARTIAQLAVRLHDGHAYVAGSVFSRQVIGDGYPPLRVRIVEGQPVVTSLHGPEAVAAGVEVGDVVVSVDGEHAAARIARYEALISAATPQGLADKIAISFMNGAVGSSVRLRLRGATGPEREVTLPRKAEDYTTLYHRERTGDVITVLAGNIGYVDLDRLTIPMVDEMFERLAGTRAIIFDMRGYPNGTVWAIAPRLSAAGGRVALLETPLVGHDAVGPSVEAFYQTIDPAPPGVRRFTGRTVMLLDERTVSQAEHTGLYLLAANGTRFVGSPSAGTDGEITTIVLPGAVTVGFTGQSVRYPDGRELQGTGLVPDVLVTPTVAGIRAGRDEVLEAAVAYLERP